MSNNLKNFVFFDRTSESDTSNSLSNPNRGSQLTVQVSADSAFKVKFQCQTNIVEGVWADVSVIDTTDYAIKSEVDSAGIYIVAMDGIAKIRCVCESGLGDVVVYGVLVE